MKTHLLLAALLTATTGSCLLFAQTALADEDQQEAQATQKQEEAKEAKWASIVLRGEMPESPGQQGLFSNIRPTLRKTIARLDQAAKDEDISGVLLRIRNPSIGRGKAAELCSAIERTRKAGKKVYAQMETATANDYRIACACDEIIMPPSGVVVIHGIHLEATYIKGLLDKLGIEADFMHVGAFKGAAEPLTRTDMSPEVRYNLTAMVDDLYDQQVKTIAGARKLSEDQVKTLIDQGLLPAEKAKEAGLIDRIAYEDEMLDALRKIEETEDVTLVKNYGKKRVDSDFSGPLGMVKLMQAMMGISSDRSSGKIKKVAIVYAEGPITSGKSQSGLFGTQTIGSDTIVAALRKAAKDESVVAIVLRVNSPGGSAVASDLIWNETQKITKPIVASMGDVAASGGYYISMGADKIIAEPGTLTGSIGVVGGKIAITGLYEKIGVSTSVISRGKNSGMLRGPGKFTESEREVLSTYMHDVYHRFTTQAAKGRKMDLEKLEGLAGGQVYTGQQAKQNGLVDDLGTLADAIDAAKQLGGLGKDDEVKLRILPKPKNLFEQMFNPTDEEASIGLPFKADLGEISKPLGYVETLRRVFRWPAATIMPFQLDIE